MLGNNMFPSILPHLSLYPTLRTCSEDTSLSYKKLTIDNISYTSDTGKDNEFNTVPRYSKVPK